VCAKMDGARRDLFANPKRGASTRWQSELTSEGPRRIEEVISQSSDRFHEWQNDVADEWRMEKPERRDCCDYNGKDPATDLRQHEFRENPKTLQKEIGGRQAVSRSGWQRNDEFVNRT